ncbi:phospholipase D-like domain-containing protein [Myxococcus sp. K15C18031901]|uniref:phospholipase D-like domain-containing protein n=1 Tax=Myxococcus dinghuensis TaxID=2906761 RepID=UPI0020A801A7|nr:phospholipase D-like domain-containing protein [Myxococcus dinghuensis]MCP3097898.1 phospholipase D-like domain-containing protein [Myxococcus dinghuensis]
MAAAGAESPRIGILGHRETVSQLHRLIEEAERQLVLVSPYLSIDKLRSLVRALHGALARKVEVKLVLRAKDVSTGTGEPLASEALQGLRAAGMEVRLLADLHAKVYLSEKCALLTSLNLLESSINNSIEVSAWLPANTPEYLRLVEVLNTDVFPMSVKVASPAPRQPTVAPREAPRRQRSQRDEVIVFGEDGHCIRCGEDLAFDVEKPLCLDCYGVWRRYGDPSYMEEYCHACGEESDTSLAKPLCQDCYRHG